MFKRIVIAVGLFYLWIEPAYAYLDPGMGSILVQGILAGIASSLAIVKIYWQRIKALFVKTMVSEEKKADYPENKV